MLGIVEAIKKKVLDIPQTVKRNVNVLIILLPVLSFSVPLLILYSLYPYSFEQTYHGRTLQLFFLWLASLEIILSWEKLQKNKVDKLGSVRTVSFIIALLLPTIYVIVANYCGLNAIIEDLARQNISPADPLRDQHASLVPLSIEYLVFAVLFCSIILRAYGINGLMDFSVSTFFLGIIGVLFTIDNFYPYGKLTPMQIFVPTTATLAANVLNLMGYETTISFVSNHPIYGSMPSLRIEDSQGRSAAAGIAWPCAGVESLLIYTVTILLFLKKTDIPWKHRIIYFVIGAVVTYFINVLRVVTLFVIALNTGSVYSTEFQRFHNYYGMLYSITWIISYLLIIIGSRALWRKIKNWKTSTKDDAKVSTRTHAQETD
jgi:thaumarchaeosortase